MTDPTAVLPTDDAVLAAPGNHQVLFENDEVRVLMTVVAAGETTPLHSHQWPAALYILSWSDCVRRDPDGQITLDTRRMAETPAAGAALWTTALPLHAIENVGNAELRIVACEVKGA